MSSLLIRTKDAPDYDTFAKRVFGLLGVEIKQERYSDNVPGERYVYGVALGIKITLLEDSDLPEFEFTLLLNPQEGWLGNYHSLDGLADIAAKLLSRNGMKVARESGSITQVGYVEYNAQS
jgi:hypothetical protein